MDRSPIENNTRPTLRGTSTCFRGSPGGWKVPTTYPPLPFICSLFPLISERSELVEVREQRAHSSSLRAVKTLLVCRGYCVVHFLQVFGSDYVILLVCSKYSQTFDYVRQVTFLPLVESFLIMFYRLVCSFVTNLLFVCFNGLQRLEQGLENGFGQGFGLRIYLPFWYVGCQMRL